MSTDASIPSQSQLTPRVEPLAEGPSALRTRRPGSNWVYSLTGICFLFGGLAAIQMRSYQSAIQSRASNAQAAVDLQRQLDDNKRQAQKAAQETQGLQKKISAMQVTILSNKGLSEKQAQQLNAQIKDLQLAAALTPVSGPGIRVVLNDSPLASKSGSGSVEFLPGMVHDFDLLQVVNELRAAGADAIAVNGTRITGYTPIRCVGPVIHVNWEAAAPPFIIEAIGSPNTLYKALEMPDGILENLQSPQYGPPLVVKISREDHLSLSAAAGGAPKLKVAKADTPAA